MAMLLAGPTLALGVLPTGAVAVRRLSECPTVAITDGRDRLQGSIINDWCFGQASTPNSNTPIAQDEQACNTKYVDPIDAVSAGYVPDCSGGCAACSYIEVNGTWNCRAGEPVYKCLDPPAPPVPMVSPSPLPPMTPPG
eukprot:scaffold276051_cov43-Tisochrysis_lutea.AAC.1